jgi:hypothetical protein
MSRVSPSPEHKGRALASLKEGTSPAAERVILFGLPVEDLTTPQELRIALLWALTQYCKTAHPLDLGED